MRGVGEARDAVVEVAHGDHLLERLRVRGHGMQPRVHRLAACIGGPCGMALRVGDQFLHRVERRSLGARVRAPCFDDRPRRQVRLPGEPRGQHLPRLRDIRSRQRRHARARRRRQIVEVLSIREGALARPVDRLARGGVDLWRGEAAVPDDRVCRGSVVQALAEQDEQGRRDDDGADGEAMVA
jgi:hypothetical protein